MAFRSEAKAGASLILLTVSAFAASPVTYEVRHAHWRHGGSGALRIDETGISFEERGKEAKHSRVWKYEDIQELVLGADMLRIVTYEDNRWQLGRDRVYVFDQLPARVAADWYPVFRARLDARFVAAIADDKIEVEWQIPVKLIHGNSGLNGSILVGEGLVVYKSEQPRESRTWRIKDIENMSSSDEFDLTITTRERAFRFQLKQAMSDARFQALWLRMNQGHGLRILSEVHK